MSKTDNNDTNGKPLPVMVKRWIRFDVEKQIACERIDFQRSMRRVSTGATT